MLRTGWCQLLMPLIGKMRSHCRHTGKGSIMKSILLKGRPTMTSLQSLLQKLCPKELNVNWKLLIVCVDLGSLFWPGKNWKLLIWSVDLDSLYGSIHHHGHATCTKGRLMRGTFCCRNHANIQWCDWWIVCPLILFLSYFILFFSYKLFFQLGFLHILGKCIYWRVHLLTQLLLQSLMYGLFNAKWNTSVLSTVWHMYCFNMSFTTYFISNNKINNPWLWNNFWNLYTQILSHITMKTCNTSSLTSSVPPARWMAKESFVYFTTTETNLNFRCTRSTYRDCLTHTKSCPTQFHHRLPCI